jgi:hypothetical protein
MSLDRYIENGWLKKEKTSPQEIADHLRESTPLAAGSPSGGGVRPRSRESERH